MTRNALPITPITIALLATLTACGPSTGTLSQQNDELRRQNLELKQEVDELSRRIQGRLEQLRAMESQPGVAAAQAADRPTLTSIAFAKFSGVADDDGDGQRDTARVYIKTLDQRGRFLPVTGSATLKAVRIPDEGQPIVLAERRWGRDAWEQAFHTGFAGTHYTLEAELQQTPQDAGPVTIQVTVTDAATGASFTEQLVD